MSLKNSLIVLWVYIMYVLGIWIFMSGFLLKRIVIHQYSTPESSLGIDIRCNDITSLHSIAKAFAHKTPSPLNTNKTYLSRYNKTIILIIDALRYDFANHQQRPVHHPEEYYTNKMPIFKKLKENSKGNALLFPLVADPPTTTLQRLKGLTTGSLPTFIDVSFSFTGTKITEDNFILQMNSYGKKVIFLGDDTWESIFPDTFHRSYPFPSFNVKDLDTVDNGILNHLYEEIEKPDSDVIIAHFLGVDHCGHRYGPTHPEMTRKLRQMNKVIEQVVEKIKEDTLLVVLGDHGMTESGDHGGDSIQEVSTALFLYSKSNLGGFTIIDDPPSIPQINIVPTLSLLLGLPVPFSNLGSIISQVFTLNFQHTCFHPELDPLVGKALAVAENTFQVRKYLHAYGEISQELPASVIFDIEERINMLSKLWNNITNDLTKNKNILSNISDEYIKLLHEIRIMCEKQWATFNLQYMITGCATLLFAALCNLVISEKFDFRHYCIIACSVAISTLFAIIFLFNLFHFFIWSAIVIVFYFCVKLLKKLPEWCYESAVKAINIPSMIALILFAMSFSNSFVVYEDIAITFLLQSVIFYRFFLVILESFKTSLSFLATKNKTTKRNQRINWGACFQPLCLLCLVLCIKLGTVFHKCREEQILCSNSDLIVSLEKLHENKAYKGLRLMLSLSSVILPSVIFFLIFHYKNSQKTKTVTAVSIKYGVFFVCVLICLRWWLNIIPANVIDKVLMGNEVFLSRAAFLTSLLLCIFIIIFPFLFEKPWTIISKEIYHGSMLSFLFCISQLLQFIVGDALSVAVMLMSLSTLFYVILINTSPSSESWIWTDVVIWYLLSCHWFYSTAHQPTFTAIPWDSAFLLYHKEVYSYILSGALVLLNTFCSNVFYGLALPILLTCTESSVFTSKSLLRLHMKYLLFFGIKLLGTILASYVLRRHLMVWKIFSPKLIYQVIGLLITMISVSIGHFFLMKITNQYHKLIRTNLKSF